MKGTKTMDGRFLRVILADMRDKDASLVVGLRQAAGRLYASLYDLRIGDEEIGIKPASPAAVEAATRRAMDEIERHTRGQAFRVDTARGPLFVEYELWKFAGECGPIDNHGRWDPKWYRAAAARKVAA